MMWNGPFGDGWGWFWPFHFIIPILFWALIIAAAVWLVRYATGRREYPQLTRRLPGLNVLEERYARGEINRDESARYLAQGTSQRSCRAESGTGGSNG